MRKINLLMLFIFAQVLLLNSSFALTPDECHQSGGACICISFPGAAPVCTHSNQTALAREDQKEKKGILHVGFAQF